MQSPAPYQLCLAAVAVIIRAPPCPQCRAAWPGASADISLRNSCAEHNIPFCRNWEQGPVNNTPQPMQELPPAPAEILPMCCERLLCLERHGEDMAGVPAGNRSMQWCPSRVFSNVGGTQVQSGWAAEWCCNSCGRVLSASDPLLRSHETRPACACGMRANLVLDFSSGRHMWICPQRPWCTQPRPVGEPSPTTAPAVRRGTAGFFSAGPPSRNNEGTNSFLYCPLLLHAARLLLPDAVAGWSRSVAWFPAVCDRLAQATCSIQQLSDVYSNLIRIAVQADPAAIEQFSRAGEFQAASNLSTLADSFPQNANQCNLTNIVPVVVDP